MMGEVRKIEPIGLANCIAVFGTSMSGKDYTIRDAMGILTKQGRYFEHASPIRMIQMLLDDKKLKNMDEMAKRALVREARDGISKRLYSGSNLLVDEHYCFPEGYGGKVIDNDYYGEKLPYHKEVGHDGRNYEVVFRDGWIGGYEMAVYMEIDPDVILERFRSSEGSKHNPYITAEDIRLWQLFELDRLQELCNDFQVPLYYIYDHTRSGEELAMIINHHFKKYHSKCYESKITRELGL